MRRISLALLLVALALPGAPRPRARVRRPPPVVIPSNYIVQPQLADLPELVPPLLDLAVAELSDSFAYRRPYDGVVHWGIDIFRPAGEPLVAVVDGRVRLVESPLGGTTVYLTTTSNDFRFYYAHLAEYAPGLRDGATVRQGDVIGYVGNSGNARYTKSHLHFEVHLLAPWMVDELGSVSVKAGVLNPCPLLRSLVMQRSNANVAQ